MGPVNSGGILGGLLPSFRLINKCSTGHQGKALQIATVCSIGGKFVTFCYLLPCVIRKSPTHTTPKPSSACHYGGQLLILQVESFPILGS